MDSKLVEYYLQQQQEALEKDFQIIQNSEICGRTVALYAWFDIEGERRTFGIMPTGNFTHCHEYCLFIPVETLEEQQIADFLQYSLQVQQKLVQPDRQHEFSLVSIVLVTDHLPSGNSLKKFKKFDSECRYTGNQAGWSNIRTAIVALEDKKLVTNRMGSALSTRLQNALNKH